MYKDFWSQAQEKFGGILKEIYCISITPAALRLIRRFDGDVTERIATICNFTHEEPSRDYKGRIIEGAFKVFFPNHNQALCYSLSGEIACVSL
jgi:hypothetical protein